MKIRSAAVACIVASIRERPLRVCSIRERLLRVCSIRERLLRVCSIRKHSAMRANACAAVAALLAATALSGCDVREQKPKVAGIGWIGAAVAQQVDGVVPPAAISGAMQPVDEAFARFAASSGLAEIEGARRVLKTSKNPDVREYAQKLAREHARAADELRRIVAPRGIVLPSAPTGRHADMVTKLSGVNAPDLDDAFLQRFGLDAHKEAIGLFERHAAEGKDPQLRRYAEQTLPMLREHMSAAHKLIYAAAAGR